MGILIRQPILIDQQHAIGLPADGIDGSIHKKLVKIEESRLRFYHRSWGRDRYTTRSIVV
jgi:hypothetical protein